MPIDVTDANEETTVTYTLTLTVRRAVRRTHDETWSEATAWMLADHAQRDLEQGILRTLRRIDGNCDCEVVDLQVTHEDE